VLPTGYLAMVKIIAYCQLDTLCLEESRFKIGEKEGMRVNLGMIRYQKHTKTYDYMGRIGIRLNGGYASLQTKAQRCLVQPGYKIGDIFKKYQMFSFYRFDRLYREKPILASSQ